jgi:hypothetical protein
VVAPLLAELMLAELLSLLLAELLSLLLGLQLLPVWMLGLLLLSLISFSRPRPPSCVFCRSRLRSLAGRSLPCMAIRRLYRRCRCTRRHPRDL